MSGSFGSLSGSGGFRRGRRASASGLEKMRRHGDKVTIRPSPGLYGMIHPGGTLLRPRKSAPAPAGSTALQPLQVTDKRPPYVVVPEEEDELEAGEKKFWLVHGTVNDLVWDEFEEVTGEFVLTHPEENAYFYVYAKVFTTASDIADPYQVSKWEIEVADEAKVSGPYDDSGAEPVRTAHTYKLITIIAATETGAWNIMPHTTGNIRVAEKVQAVPSATPALSVVSRSLDWTRA